MLIKLLSGELLLPQGDITVENYGVKISGFDDFTVIPHAQIRWIHQGSDLKEEMKTYNQMKSRRKANPIAEIDKLSSGELVKGLW